MAGALVKVKVATAAGGFDRLSKPFDSCHWDQFILGAEKYDGGRRGFVDVVGGRNFPPVGLYLFMPPASVGAVVGDRIEK